MLRLVEKAVGKLASRMLERIHRDLDGLVAPAGFPEYGLDRFASALDREPLPFDHGVIGVEAVHEFGNPIVAKQGFEIVQPAAEMGFKILAMSNSSRRVVAPEDRNLRACVPVLCLSDRRFAQYLYPRNCCSMPPIVTDAYG